MKRLLVMVLLVGAMLGVMYTPPAREVTDAEWDYFHTVDEALAAERVNTVVVDALLYAGADSSLAPQLAESFERHAAETDVDPKLLIAIASVESQFIPSARSSAGAVGVMQVLPDRKAWGKYEEACGARMTRQNLLDPDVNICFGAHIYRWFRDAHGNRTTALHAYNNGTGRNNGYADKVLRTLKGL